LFHRELDEASINVIGYNTMKTYSSREAAAKLGISLMTLQRYIADGNWIKAPKLKELGQMKARLWTDRDVERARKLIEEK
jgi:transposase